MEFGVGERIIVLIDMDCFYVQVEQKLCPEYDNKPCSVVQYQTWKGGSIIAVNYEARAFGVKRGMRGDDAIKICPDIHNFRVPELRGKADLTRYRDAGASIIEVLCEFCDCVERASIDEAYLDITSVVSDKMKNFDSPISASQLPNTFVIGWNKESDGDDVQSWLDNLREDDMLNDKKLAIAAIMVEELRLEVYNKTKLRCSAGIANNKMLAKLACGLHKPNKQTVLPHSSVPIFFNTLPLHKIRNLGGKLGAKVKETLNVDTMGDLRTCTELQLHKSFGEKTGSWLYSISRGLEHETVNSRQLPKSVGCSKNFNGMNILNTKSKVSHWMLQLASELDERLQKDQIDNRRFAKLLTVTVRNKDDDGGNIYTVSRTLPIHVYSAQKFANDALNTIQKLNTSTPASLLWNPPVVNLALSASKFEDKLDSSSCNILSYFTSPSKNIHSNQKEDSLTSSDILIENLNSKDKGQIDLHQVIHKKHRSIDYYFDRSTVLANEMERDKPTTSDSAMLPESLSVCSKEFKIQNGSSIMKRNFSSYIDEPYCIQERNEGKLSFFLEKVEKRTFSEYDSKEITANVAQSGNFERSTSTSIFQNNCHSMTSNISDAPGSTCISDINEKSEIEIKDDISLLLNQMIDQLQNNILCINSNETEISFDGVDAFTANSAKIPFKVQHESDLPSELTFFCIKCNQKVPVWEEQEHCDYHIALDIQNGLKTQSQTKALLFCSNYSKQKGSKRKSSSKISAQKNKIVKQKVNTLDAFIKQI